MPNYEEDEAAMGMDVEGEEPRCAVDMYVCVGSTCVTSRTADAE